MDVSRPRERVISILNDNDCPSFSIRRPESPILSKEHPLPLSHPKLERPHLQRYRGYAKQPSPLSEPSTPPLLRHDSSSSTSSAMDNSPSPITPEYPYLDAQSNVITPYDTIIHQQLNGYLPSPTTITPLIETGMMIAPSLQDPTVPFMSKPPNTSFTAMPSPAQTSTGSIQAVQHTVPEPAPVPQLNQLPQQPKKNKYPCPYANSHGCLATFTTSGHAARHGKKHTGEKGVHCPTCGKAFTRKDNMKQHERTHKNSASTANSSDDSRKSKAAVTKAAVAERSHKRAESEAKSNASGQRDNNPSPLGEVSPAEVAQHALVTPISSTDPVMYDEDAVAAVNVVASQPPEPMMPSYPPLDEATLGQINQRPMPAFPRTFSDLDTLAMAAAYDPYHTGPNGQL